MTAGRGIMYEEMPHLVSGQPLGEPIARHGLFVMNTEQEIEQALLELRQGTFVMTWVAAARRLIAEPGPFTPKDLLGRLPG